MKSISLIVILFEPVGLVLSRGHAGVALKEAGHTDRPLGNDPLPIGV